MECTEYGYEHFYLFSNYFVNSISAIREKNYLLLELLNCMNSYFLLNANHPIQHHKGFCCKTNIHFRNKPSKRKLQDIRVANNPTWNWMYDMQHDVLYEWWCSKSGRSRSKRADYNIKINKVQLKLMKVKR